MRLSGPLLEVQNLAKVFVSRHRRRGGKGRVYAVDGISFSVATGESVGIAGESGSGKSTLARMILRLETPTEGCVRFDGADIGAVSDASGMAYRRQVQAVFQDSNSALNPRMRIHDIVSEPLALQQPEAPPSSVKSRVADVLSQVGLSQDLARRYPHELSGGQKQRVAIARALIVSPRLLVLDEPVSALDVSVRSQVLNLLLDLQEEFALTYLMIAHDLAVLRHVTTRLLVMYKGRVVEEGRTEDVLHRPQHEYTRRLVAAVPGMQPGRERQRITDADPEGRI